MSLVRSLRSLFNPQGRTRRYSSHGAATGPRYRPALEDLEGRLVLSSPASLAPPALGAALAAPAQQLTSIVPLNIQGVAVQNGQLVAQGLLGNTPFTAPLTLSTSPSADPDCPILHLRVDAIHLNLLGLKVDTSNICLDITAESGSGNLLGNLLCDVSHLLDTGTPLGTVLGGLSGTQLTTLTGGLTNLLNGVLGQLTAPPAVAGVSGASCDILNLSLGPVDLNLLGLDVHLDNCANGPVTVDVTAQPGPGKLLGNLLCGLSHVLDSNASTTAILNKLTHIAQEILSLI